MSDDKDFIESISYRPNIKPTKKYYSDIDFDALRSIDGLDQVADDIELIETSPNYVDSELVLENIDRMESLLDFIPNEMSENLSDILDGMKIIIDKHPIDYEQLNRPDKEYIEYPTDKPKPGKPDDKNDYTEYPDGEPILPEWKPDESPGITPSPDDKDRDTIYTERDDYEDTEEQSDNYRDDYDFELEDNEPIVHVIVDVNEPDKNRYLNEHNLHIAQIFNKYIKNMNTIMSKYFTKIISTLDLSSGEGLKYLLREYIVSSNDIEDQNLKHLSDTIIKNQIINKQNIMLFNKLFTKKEFQKHLRFCKVAALSRDRYHNLEYEDVSTIEGIIIDSLLSKERLMADIKYKESFKNLYKFLTSQLDTMSDILDNTIETLLSKSILTKEERGGIELATNTELFVSRYANSLEREIERREEREAQLAQRQKEREEKEKARSM